MQNPWFVSEFDKFITRRHFFGRTAAGIGVTALASLLNPSLFAALSEAPQGDQRPTGPNFPPRAKRVIYLFMAGGPSQLDLFDYKPGLAKLRGKELPASVRGMQRLTGMTSGQGSLPVAPSIFNFSQHGQSGAWISELLPHTAQVADDLCFIRTVNTEAINHDPATTYIMTGAQQPGRPAMGSWVTYGLGSESRDLPGFVVLISRGSAKRDAQPLYARLWSSGFLPSIYQGVQFRTPGDPVLYLSNPKGISPQIRRSMLDGLDKLNQKELEAFGDPEITTRIAQYEMAFRMQTSVPELTDFSDEPELTFKLYGDEARRPGTFAANCLLARRMAERGVRFIQLFHRGWDQHGDLPSDIGAQCHDVDQPSAGLVADLKQRGLLDDTLVVWGGEFGRTVYCQGKLEPTNYGRDHHGRCFTVWLAGGGVKGGVTHGTTDDYCYNIVEKPVHIHDLAATLLACLGINHEKLTFLYKGRNFRLTDVYGNVVHEILV